MEDLNQDPQSFLHQNQEELQSQTEPFDSGRFSPLSAAIAANSHHPSPPPVFSFGANPNPNPNPIKRSSSSMTPYSLQDQDAILTSNGFSKITLPNSFGSDPNRSRHFLRRCISDPTNACQSPENGTISVNSVAPSSAGKGSGSASGFRALPPSVRQSPANTSSGSPSNAKMCMDLMKQHSPESKRLKRMRERLWEMSQWWNEVLQEQEQDAAADEEDDAKKDENEIDFEETVRVERVGESLNLRFKCPCGRGFETLLSGRNCYYKLL